MGLRGLRREWGVVSVLLAAGVGRGAHYCEGAPAHCSSVCRMGASMAGMYSPVFVR